MNILTVLGLTQHDKHLIEQLAGDGMDCSIIAEKFELQTSDVVQLLHPSKFFVPAKSFALKLKRGSMRISSDFDGLEKLCKQCNEWHPLDLDFWHRQKSNPDGAYNHCKACELSGKRESRATQRALRGLKITVNRQLALKEVA